MSKLPTTLLSFALCSSPVFAGPSMPGMAAEAAGATPRVETPPANAVTTGITFESLAQDRPAALADGAELALTDSHPMIPVPPAIWAGFVGLAYVARRVTRRQAI